MITGIAIGILGSFIALIVVSKLAPQKPKPEWIYEGAVGCTGQDTAIAIARAASASRNNPAEFPKWVRQEGGALGPSGIDFVHIEEEAGQVDVIKISIGTREMYLLWLFRSRSLEKRHDLAAGLKLQHTAPIGVIPPLLLSSQPEREE